MTVSDRVLWYHRDTALQMALVNPLKVEKHPRVECQNQANQTTTRISQRSQSQAHIFARYDILREREREREREKE